ncbi:MAG: DUF3054 domain-containing protein [Pseudonocardia sp.]
MSPGRIPTLALVADLVAVVVFAAVGRLAHGPGDGVAELFGLAATAAPFLLGLAAAWASPYVRIAPAGLRAGCVVLASTVVVGLLLRAAFTGRLPPSFVLVTAVTLAVLLVGWRALSMLVAHRVAHR